MRRLITALAAGLLTSLAAFAPAQAGPAWWRISDGASVLWVLGVPDMTLTQFDWDQTSLNHRLDKADHLYNPTLGGVFQRPPSGAARSVDTRSGPGFTGLPNGSVPDGFLPTPIAMSTDAWRVAPSDFEGPFAPPRSVFVTAPNLLSRVKAVASDRNPFAYNRLRDNQTARIAQWLDQTNWPKGATGNAVAWRAFQIGKSQNVPTTQIVVPNPLRLQTDGNSTTRIRAPQAVQEACLRMVIEESESGLMPKIRADGLAAWARGDIEHSLKRGSDLSACLYGQEPSTDAAAAFQRDAFIYFTETDAAFANPGRQSVAVIALDPLLADHGVLAHYRQLGYVVSLSDGMGE